MAGPAEAQPTEASAITRANTKGRIAGSSMTVTAGTIAHSSRSPCDPIVKPASGIPARGTPICDAAEIVERCADAYSFSQPHARCGCALAVARATVKARTLRGIPEYEETMSVENIVIIVVIVLIVLFVLGYFGRGRMRG
ncbi:MAG: hypothetical protein ABI553_01855 [Chloroflexota bacterium]